MTVIIQLVFKIQVEGRWNQCLYILIHPMKTLKHSLTVFHLHSRHSCVTILPHFCQQNFSPGARQEFPYSHELGFAWQKESFPVQGVSIGYSEGPRAQAVFVCWLSSWETYTLQLPPVQKKVNSNCLTKVESLDTCVL